MGQPRKDSSEDRVNFDNTRVDKFEKDISGMKESKPADSKPSSKKRRRRKPGGSGSSSSKGGSGDQTSAAKNRYARNPGLLGAASSYTLGSYATGQKLPFVYENSSHQRINQTVPGIMTLGWEPSFGGDNITALNQALNSIFSFVVHANSRNMDKYNAMDQGCFILGGANFFAYLESLKRVYGYMRWVNETNEYAPAALIEALGFDYADLQKNLSNMWFDINYLVTLSRQIWIPNIMPVIFRWMEMNSVVYTDGDSPKSQMYAYVPARLLMIDETISETGTCLRPVVYSQDPTVGGSENDLVDFTHNPINQVANAPYTWENAMGIAMTMLNALINSDSRGLIYGDILKAYGSEGIYAASEIDAAYLLAPVFSKDALSRIENATVVPQIATALVQNQYTSTLDTVAIMGGITPDVDNSYLYPTNVVFNMHKTDVSAEEILYATEHTIAGSDFHLVKPLVIKADTTAPSGYSWEVAAGMENGVSVAYPSSSGTEIITSMNIANKGKFPGQGLLRRLTNLLSDVNGHALTLAEYLSFDWAPWLYHSYTAHPVMDVNWNPDLAVGDFDNYMILSPTDVLKIHTAVVYDAFGVPVSMR